MIQWRSPQLTQEGVSLASDKGSHLPGNGVYPQNDDFIGTIWDNCDQLWDLGCRYAIFKQSHVTCGFSDFTGSQVGESLLGHSTLVAGASAG